MSNKFCSVCSDKLCSFQTNSKDLLIILDSPDEISLQKGRLISTSPYLMSPGKILKKELEIVGMSLVDFSLASIWQHAPNKLEECWKLGYDTVLSVAKGKKAILLVGAEAVETFTGYKVSEVSGLRVDSSVLSAPLIMATVSPGLAMSHSVGEVRHGITKWKLALEQKGLI